MAGKHPDEKSDDQTTDEQWHYHTLSPFPNEEPHSDMESLGKNPP